MTMADPSFSSTPYTPDRLIAGSFPLLTEEVTLTDNQGQGAIARGSILGVVAGVFAKVHQTGSYAAATARAILAKDADPSGGDVQALVYLVGEFNEDELSAGGTVTVEQCRTSLRDYGIVLRNPVSA